MKKIYKDYQNSMMREDTTKFGEFVCSCHKWLPLEEQKEKAKKLENVTKID